MKLSNGRQIDAVANPVQTYIWSYARSIVIFVAIKSTYSIKLLHTQYLNKDNTGKRKARRRIDARS